MIVPLYCKSHRNELNQKLLNECAELSWVEIINKPGDVPFMIIEDGRLGIADASWPKVLPVFADFASGTANHRRLHGGGTGQAVAKAVGLNKRSDLIIWDATAGLGRDGFVMASLGATVTLFERNPVVHLVLRDGLDILGLSGDPDLMEIAKRLSLVSKSFNESTNQIGSRPDVIYLDPMFPERAKSAKVKKDMSLFHDIVGDDLDADDLLEPAMAMAELRVVVKRPKKAPWLADKKPTTALIGKSSRFDIYSKKKIG